MENKVNVIRKNNCFPAYDDEVGVKIVREGRRSIFAEHESLITSAGHSDSEERSYRRHSKIVNEKAGHTPEQKKELEKHRANLPDYSKAQGPQKTATGRTILFGEGPKRASYTVRRDRNEQTEVERTSYVAEKERRTMQKKSAFVPTYVPASVIPEKEEDFVSQEELLGRMKKDANSFLLFDNESAPYQVKQNEDQPAVRRFNNGSTDINMTRKEYKKIGRNKSVLERSLSGLIDEDQANPRGYFPN